MLGVMPARQRVRSPNAARSMTVALAGAIPSSCSVAPAPTGRFLTADVPDRAMLATRHGASVQPTAPMSRPATSLDSDPSYTCRPSARGPKVAGTGGPAEALRVTHNGDSPNG